MENIKQTLLTNGYICMSENEKRMSFNLGYTNEELKLSLWKKHEYNRDGYTSAKETFITEETEKAKAKYGNQY